METYCLLYFLVLIDKWELQAQLYQNWKFPQKNNYSKIPKQMNTTQYPDFFVTCQGGSNMNTGNRNPTDVDDESSFIQFSQQSLSSRLVSD